MAKEFGEGLVIGLIGGMAIRLGGESVIVKGFKSWEEVAEMEGCTLVVCIFSFFF